MTRLFLTLFLAVIAQSQDADVVTIERPAPTAAPPTEVIRIGDNRLPPANQVAPVTPILTHETWVQVPLIEFEPRLAPYQEALGPLYVNQADIGFARGDTIASLALNPEQLTLALSAAFIDETERFVLIKDGINRCTAETAVPVTAVALGPSVEAPLTDVRAIVGCTCLTVGPSQVLLDCPLNTETVYVEALPETGTWEPITDTLPAPEWQGVIVVPSPQRRPSVRPSVLGRPQISSVASTLGYRPGLTRAIEEENGVSATTEASDQEAVGADGETTEAEGDSTEADGETTEAEGESTESEAEAEAESTEAEAESTEAEAESTEAESESTETENYVIGVLPPEADSPATPSQGGSVTGPAQPEVTPGQVSPLGGQHTEVTEEDERMDLLPLDRWIAEETETTESEKESTEEDSAGASSLDFLAATTEEDTEGETTEADDSDSNSDHEKRILRDSDDDSESSAEDESTEMTESETPRAAFGSEFPIQEPVYFQQPIVPQQPLQSAPTFPTLQPLVAQQPIAGQESPLPMAPPSPTDEEGTLIGIIVIDSNDEQESATTEEREDESSEAEVAAGESSEAEAAADESSEAEAAAGESTEGEAAAGESTEGEAAADESTESQESEEETSESERKLQEGTAETTEEIAESEMETSEAEASEEESTEIGQSGLIDIPIVGDEQIPPEQMAIIEKILSYTNNIEA